VSISFLDLRFIALAVAALLLLRALRGWPRQVAFLALNLLFVGPLVLGTVGATGTVVFVLLGYALVQVAIRKERRGLVTGGILLVAVFVYMRRYDFLAWILPGSLLTTALRTTGLSFVFFKVLHVMIDAYSGALGRLDPLTYLNYCLNFTTFIMGPIQRYQDYRDQWGGVVEGLPADYEAHLDSVLRALIGIIKAYFLADFFLSRALRPNTDLLDLTPGDLVVQAYAFWIFLYLNFSGYCDVAIGLGSLLGVRPPENFDRPFLARNISDFWQRQHRSLTLWLTDYVFTPLYAKLLTVPWTARHKLLAANLALMTTMLVSGLWHGTTLGFLLFGVVHGLWFVIYRSWDALLTKRLGRAGAQRFRAHPLVHAGGVFCTFNATAFAFIFFRVSPERLAQAFRALLS